VPTVRGAGDENPRHCRNSGGDPMDAAAFYACENISHLKAPLLRGWRP